jgi:peroxiredoxin
MIKWWKIKVMNHSRIFLLIAAFLIGSFYWGCSSNNADSRPLMVGDKAADVPLMDATGHPFKLSDVQPGWYSVLFFYRGAWCASCQEHLLNFKQNFPKYTAAHIALAAISVDSVEDAAVFNDQWRFPFPLLSDSQFRLVDRYGLRDPKKGHHQEDISKVAVVIVDPKGIICYKYVGREAWDRPNDDEIIDTVQKIQSGTPIPATGGAS